MNGRRRARSPCRDRCMVRPCLDLPRFRDWVSSTLGTACRSRGGSEDFTARRRLPRTREGESSRCKHFGQRRAWGVRRRRRLIGSRIRSWQLVVKTPKPSSWRHECLLWCGSPQRGRRPGKQPTLRSCGSQRADGRLEEGRSASSQATRRKPPSSTRRFLAGDSLPHPARVEEQLEGSRSDFGIHAGRSSPTARQPGNLCHFLNLSPPGGGYGSRLGKLEECKLGEGIQLSRGSCKRGAREALRWAPLAISLRVNARENSEVDWGGQRVIRDSAGPISRGGPGGLPRVRKRDRGKPLRAG